MCRHFDAVDIFCVWQNSAKQPGDVPIFRAAGLPRPILRVPVSMARIGRAASPGRSNMNRNRSNRGGEDRGVIGESRLAPVWPEMKSNGQHKVVERTDQGAIGCRSKCAGNRLRPEPRQRELGSESPQSRPQCAPHPRLLEHYETVRRRWGHKPDRFFTDRSDKRRGRPQAGIAQAIAVALHEVGDQAATSGA
jgi:hypothetical protein